MTEEAPKLNTASISRMENLPAVIHVIIIIIQYSVWRQVQSLFQNDSSA